MKHKKTFPLVIASTLLLGGCSILPTGNPEYAAFGDNRVTAASANQLFPDKKFEKVDLLHALDPEEKRVLSDNKDKNIERAYEAFYRYNGPEYVSLELRRNRIQDRILTASEQRCNLFKTYIKRVDSYNKIVSGSLATILGGLGAIMTPASTVRALSGSAAIVSGVGAEYSQGLFSDMAIHVLVPGIEIRRKELRGAIDRKQLTSIRVYPIEEAITDAVRFHGACSINVGLEVAGKAVKEVRNPGLATMKWTLLQLAQARQFADGLKTGEIKRVTIDGEPVSMDENLSISPPQAAGKAIQPPYGSIFSLGLGSFINLSEKMPIEVLAIVQVDITKRLNGLKEAVKAEKKKQTAANADLNSSLIQIKAALQAGTLPAGTTTSISQQLQSLKGTYSTSGGPLLEKWHEVATAADKSAKAAAELALSKALAKFQTEHLAKLEVYWNQVRMKIEEAHVQNKEGKFSALLATMTDLNKEKIDTILQ